MSRTLKLFCVLLSAGLAGAAGGCASNEVAVARQPEVLETAPAKADQPAVSPVPAGTVLNAIVAIVNDDVVTLSDVNREAVPVIREAEKKAPVDGAVRSQIRRAALDHLVEKKLVDQKIRELGVKVSDEEVQQAIDDVKRQNGIPSQDALVKALEAQGLTYEQYRSQLREQIEKLKLISMEVRAKIQVGETEMREFYEANRAKYSEEDTFRARHIFFRIKEKATADEIKRSMTTALLVLAEAKEGKDFAALASTYSEDPAARKDGGMLGTFKKGDMMPELESSITAMRPGDVSELIHTPSGFHIVKLEEKISGRMKPFESVRSDVEENLYRKKSEERFSQWARELRSKASIEIKELKGIL